MSASSTTSTTDDNRSEMDDFVAGKVVCRTPAIMTDSAYGVSEFSAATAGPSRNMVSTSTISTLDRSAYQSLPLSGTRRITVQFGNMKIVVPWKDSGSATVGDLTDAALTRYRRASGNPTVNIVRLECASDGGILDQDDVLEDVFDFAFDQILAITDEAGPQHHYAQPLPVNRTTGKPVASAYGSVSVQNPAPGHKSRRDSVVEVKNLASAVSPGLRVHKTPTAVRLGSDENEPQLRSSLRNDKKQQERQQARVTLSPEVEKKLAERERPHYEKNTSANRLLRSSDRKSRINDTFMDAMDRLSEKYGQESSSPQQVKPVKKLGPVAEGAVAGSTVVTFLAPDNIDFGGEEIIGMGVEVNAVYDDSMEATTPSTSMSSKLTAVQIMRIDKDGRIGRDGRLKVGDNIIEIDGRPVYQMSILRARAYIADLAVSSKDATITVLRSIETFSDSDQIDQKPIFSALQAANTQYIGQTQIVELIKSSNGFGFTVTGRETAKGERLFYIGTVKPYGVALGHLKSGDRLLEINGESTGTLTQLEIVDRLKVAMVGSKVRFLVSRVSPPANEKENEPPVVAQAATTDTPPKIVEPDDRDEVEDSISPKYSRFELVIPLNDSGSAGLGVSLKARVSVKSDGSRHDCGIFIKNVMHGGAAFKDGRLKVNDRIVGIEDIELESLKNSAASDALTKKLKSIGPSSSHVKLLVVRDAPSSSISTRKAGPISRDSSRITVDATSPSPSSSSRITTPASFITSPHPTTTDSHSRQTSSEVSSAKGGADDEAMNETMLNGDVDPFDREAPGRKSLSEKRGIGAATGDPQHIKLFQEIKHQRQNSAPPSSTSRSASEKRSKSQPRSMSQRNYYHRKQQQLKSLETTPQPPLPSTLPREKPIDAGGVLNRRSLSMESINPKPGPLTAVHFSTPNGKEHPFPPGGSPLMRIKNEENRSRDKSRRKSVGNAMRSFFGFGTKSRDASPEKQPAVQLTSSEKIRQPVFMDYGDAYQQPGPSGYEFAADAELYGRYAAHRYPPPPPLPPTTRDAENAFYWGRGDEQNSRLADSPATANQQNAPYVNYGLPTSHSYHATPTVFTGGGSYSAASIRRAYAHQHHQQHFNDNDFFDDTTYQQIIIGGGSPQPPPPSSASGNARRQTSSNYHNAFNTWFAYTGGGAIGAQPMLRDNAGFGIGPNGAKSYGSPVRIAAASSIRDAAYAQQYPRGDASSSTNGRRSRNNDAQEKYADVRTATKQSSDSSNGGSSTRFFIPRHGGGIAAAATFATGRTTTSASPSNQQFRRRGSGSGRQQRASSATTTTAPQPPPHRFPQY